MVLPISLEVQAANAFDEAELWEHVEKEIAAPTSWLLMLRRRPRQIESFFIQ
nr:hypothetical protein Q903MT_gene2757 [Picea sitchensis]